MRFTKSDIEEIARRIAVTTKRDSDLPDADIPLNDTERVPLIQYIPLVQDYENRLLSLADLRSLVLADTDQTSIGCALTVNCSTEGAEVSIKGEQRTSYTGHYGEMVDVIITADGYDTWIGVVTLTQNHTLIIALNKSGGEAPGPEQETYWIKVTNTQGAKITLNGTQVASGSINTFSAGATVDVVVSLEGYGPFVDSYPMDRNWTIPVSLTKKSSEPEEPFLYFKEDAATIPSDGGRVTVDLLSNIDWVITASEPYRKDDEEGGDTPSPEPSPSPEDTPVDTDLPSEMTVYQGETQDIY